MIRGYVEQPSPRAGETMALRVATDAPQFRVDVYRWGARLDPVGESEWLAGEDAPLHLPYQDCGRLNRGLAGEELPAWSRHELPVPADWSSGCYLAVLVEGDGRSRPRTPASPPMGTVEADGSCPGFDVGGTAFFVVRPAAGAPTRRLLYKVPLFTYHAYNMAAPETFDRATLQGHWSLYNLPWVEWVPIRFPRTVNLHRPGGGSGGAPFDRFNFDPFDPTPRQTFGHWDARMVRWLEGAGYTLDYCTDLDLHLDGPDLLTPYRLLVSAGHDEYWSAEMRSAVEAYAAGGGNVAFFAGNVAWWQVEFDTPHSFARTREWWEVPGRPENLLTGVSFRNGGERDRDDHPQAVGYRVQHADHWVLDGTGLADGDQFGERPEEYLVGYEADGADFDRADLEAGRAVSPSGRDGTPETFTILGVGDTRASGWGLGNGAATMGVFRPGGTVFTAGTTDWPRVLTQGRTRGQAVVEQVTRNVLDRLG